MVYECVCDVNLTRENISYLPWNPAKVRIEEKESGAYLLVGADEIKCSDISPFTVPKSTTAKVVNLDVTGLYKVKTVKLRFNNFATMQEFSNHLQTFVTAKAAKKSAWQFMSNPQAAPKSLVIRPHSSQSQKTPQPSSSSYQNTLSSSTCPVTSQSHLASALSSLPRTTHSALMEEFSDQPGTSKSISSHQSSGRSEGKRNESSRHVDTPSRKRHLPTIPDIDEEAPAAEDVPSKSFEIGNETKKARRTITLNSSDTESKVKSPIVEEAKRDFVAPPSSPTTPKSSSSDLWTISRRNGVSDPYRHRSMTNLGNSCYMNASLQALASLPLFITDLFKAVPENAGEKERSALLEYVTQVYRHIFSAQDRTDRSDRRKYGNRCQGATGPVPSGLLRDVRKAAGAQIEASMADSAQHDAQEFVSRLIDVLCDEIDGKLLPLNKRPSSNKENLDMDDDEHEACPGMLTLTDKLRRMNYFEDVMKIYEEPKPLNNPGHLFNFSCYTRLVCNTCEKTVKNPETGYEIQLSLHPGKRTVSSLLEAQFERHDIEWKCPECQESHASMSHSIKDGPEYLIIILKRYSYGDLGGDKSCEKIYVDPHLYLGDLCEGSEKKDEELIARMPLHSDTGEFSQEDVVPDSAQNSPMKMDLLTPQASPIKGAQHYYGSPIKPRRMSQYVGDAAVVPVQTDSQSSKDLFEDDEDDAACMDPGIGDDVALNLSGEANRSKTPEPTKEFSPPEKKEEQIEIDQADTPPESPRGGEEEHYDEIYEGEYPDEMWQKGGAVLTINNRLSSTASADSSTSDAPRIVDEKAPTEMWWKPLTVHSIITGVAAIDEVLNTRDTDEVDKWRKHTFDVNPRQIKPVIDKSQLKRVSVGGDGACLFRSFSWWLCNGNEQHHDIIRNKICDFIQAFPVEFEPLAGDNWDGYGSCEEYVAWMRTLDKWGTQAEIFAMATLLQCTIFSYHNGRFMRFTPRFYWFFDQKTKKPMRLDEPNESDVKCSGAIYIYNTSNAHFEPVVAVKSEPLVDVEKDEMEHVEDVEAVYGPEMGGDRDLNQNEDMDDIAAGRITPPACISEPEDALDDQFELGSTEFVRSEGPCYTLSAVVNHIGLSLSHGHYTAFSFDPDRKKWLKCDDSVITETSLSTVLEQSQSQGYLLVYRRRHPGDEDQFD